MTWVWPFQYGKHWSSSCFRGTLTQHSNKRSFVLGIWEFSSVSWSFEGAWRNHFLKLGCKLCHNQWIWGENEETCGWTHKHVKHRVYMMIILYILYILVSTYMFLDSRYRWYIHIYIYTYIYIYIYMLYPRSSKWPNSQQPKNGHIELQPLTLAARFFFRDSEIGVVVPMMQRF